MIPASLNTMLMGHTSGQVFDPYWTYVTFLESFDASGTAPFVDKASGLVESKTADQYTADGKFGGAMVTTETSGFYSVDEVNAVTFGTGDFTIEAWVKFENVAGLGTGFYQCMSGFNWALRVYSTQVLSAGNLGSGVVPFDFTAKENTWFHLAVSRTNGVSTIYIDGVGIHTQANTNSVSGSRIELNRPSGAGTCIAYMDECRFTKGVGRYPINFTPPTDPYPSS